MKSVSNYYKDKIRSGDTRNFLVKIDLTLADDTEITITEHDILSGSFKLSSACSSDSSFDIGSAIIGKCEFSLVNFDDRYMQFDFFNATAVVWVKLEGDNEYHRIGFYTVDEPTYAGSIIQIEMLDNMWLFDVPLADVGLSFPVSLGICVSVICSHCGVTLADSQFHGYSFQLTGIPDQEMNCREFLQYVAMISCNFCVMDSQGQLRLRWYNAPSISEDSLDGGSFLTSTTPYSDGDDADGGNFISYGSSDYYDGGSFAGEDIPYFTRLFTRNLITDEILITGVKFVINDTEYIVNITKATSMPTASASNVGTIVQYTGTTSGTYTKGTFYECVYSSDSYMWKATNYQEYVLVLDNPLVTESNVNNVLNLIWDVLEGFKMRGFKVTALPDIAPEVGDYVAVSYKGNMVYTYLSSFEFTPSACTAALGCEAPTRNLQRRYSKSVQTAVEVARKTTNNIITEYDNLVQLMNSVAVNAIGGYEDYEDLQTGGRIWYVSNRPITKVNNVCSFVAGSTVFKKTGEGFYVSTDGGQTYVNGYDSQTGLLVVNILSAIGVVANWIRTGEISDSLNYNYWNLDTGEFRLTQGAKVRYDQTDYSGAYVPTLSNSPASSWTTLAQMDEHVGQTFQDTTTGIDYIFKKGAMVYPESAHPYAPNEDKVYKLITGLENSLGIGITFDSRCQLESPYDYLDVGYVSNGTFYAQRYTGTFGGRYLPLPPAPVWIVWHSDHSVNYWGWAIESIEETDGTQISLDSYDVPTPTDIISGYYWEESTLEEFTKSISQVAVRENMTYEEIMYALTGGGQNQGIYNYDGKIYLNGQYVMAESINAKDIATGTMLFDRCSGGVLALGGLNNEEGKMIVTDTPYDGQSGSLSAGTQATLVFAPVTDGKLWINISSSAPDGTACGSYKLGSASFKPLYNGDNYIGIYLNGSYSIIVDATYDLSYTLEMADAIVTADNTGIKTNHIIAEGGQIGATVITDNELYNLGDYLIKESTWNSPLASGKEKSIIAFRPYTYNIKDSSFTIKVEFPSGLPRRIVVWLEKYTSGSWTQVTNSGILDIGTTSYTFSYFISNSDTTRWRVILTTQDYVSSKLLFETKVYFPSIHICSLSAEGFVGTYRGAFNGNGSFSNVSCNQIIVNNDGDEYIATEATEITKYDGSSYYTARWQSASDERVKENIEALDIELSKNLIEATQPKRFKYKNVEGIHYGMIAQEARKILNSLGETDAVLERSLGLSNELSGIEDERMIDYEEYIAHIINYIKWQQSKIDKMEEEIKILKGDK